MKHLLVFACVLAVAGLGFAQECPAGACDKPACESGSCEKPCEGGACDKTAKAECDTAKADCKKDRAAMIAKLEAMAAKGCPSSKMKLALITKTAGATDVESLKARVAAFETYAPQGCEVSKQVLARIDGEMTPAATPNEALSARVAVLASKADAGDAKAKETLIALGRGEGECCGTFVARVGDLEKMAAKGCGESSKKLAAMEAKMPKAAPLSLRVQKMAGYADKGCETSAAALKNLGGECGTGCAKTMVAMIDDVEGCAGDGCGMCTMELARMEAKLAAAPAAAADAPAKAKSKECGDCTDCSKCTDCAK